MKLILMMILFVLLGCVPIFAMQLVDSEFASETFTPKKPMSLVQHSIKQFADKTTAREFALFIKAIVTNAHLSEDMYSYLACSVVFNHNKSLKRRDKQQLISYFIRKWHEHGHQENGQINAILNFLNAVISGDYTIFNDEINSMNSAYIEQPYLQSVIPRSINGLALIVKENDIDCGTRFEERISVLRLACRLRMPLLVKHLLLLGANPNIEEDRLVYEDVVLEPLLIEAIKSNQTEIAKLLIDFGAQKEDVDKIHSDPLIVAAHYNNREIISYLMKKGVNINGQYGQHWYSPLALRTRLDALPEMLNPNVFAIAIHDLANNTEEAIKILTSYGALKAEYLGL